MGREVGWKLERVRKEAYVSFVVSVEDKRRQDYGRRTDDIVHGPGMRELDKKERARRDGGRVWIAC